MMRPLENKRKAMEKQNESKPKTKRNQNECNSLKFNGCDDLSKVKESKVSSSKRFRLLVRPRGNPFIGQACEPL